LENRSSTAEINGANVLGAFNEHLDYQMSIVVWIERRASFLLSLPVYAAMFRRRTESGTPRPVMEMKAATPKSA
jgi:hypothetical protein